MGGDYGFLESHGVQVHAFRSGTWNGSMGYDQVCPLESDHERD